ncbi:MAG: multidrug efflux SMR transporter [Synechococcus sp.]
MQLSYILLTISIGLGAIGQICLKIGALKSDAAPIFFLEPRVIVGFAIYFISALMYTFALKKLPLSVAFPSVSLSYVLVSFLAHLIFKEAFGARQMFSLVLIASGVFLLNKS